MKTKRKAQKSPTAGAALMDDITLWAGTEESFQQTTSIFKKMADSKLTESEARRLLMEDSSGSMNEVDMEDAAPCLVMQGDLAVIEVSGAMYKGKLGWVGKYFGVTGYQDIIDSCEYARSHGVKDFLFIWDTPGGSVDGISQTSTYLTQLAQNYNVQSYTEKALSAGCWLSTIFGANLGTEMSQFGSVGMFGVHADMSERYAQEGIKLTVFRSTELKGAGSPYEPLSEEAKAVMQEDIDKNHQFFIDRIATNLNLPHDYVAKNIALGKSWYAQDAIDLKLAKGIAPLNSVIQNMSIEIIKGKSMTATTHERTLLDTVAAAVIAGVPIETALAAAQENTGNEETSTETAQGEESNEATQEATATTVTTTAQPAPSLDSQLLEQLVAAKVEAGALKSKLETMQASFDSMRAVVATAIQRAQVGCGSAPTATEALMAVDASALLDQYRMVSSALAARYPISRQSEAVTQDSEGRDTVAASAEESWLLECAKIKPSK